MMDKIKKIANIIGKQNLILIAFIFIVLVITGLYQTFSLYTSSDGISVIDGLKTYKFILNANNDTNTITIAAHSTKKIAITVTNEETIDLLYGIYYSTSADLSSVNMGYLSTNEHLAIDTITAKGKYVVKFGIDNFSNNNITITFGIKYGLPNGGDLTLDSGTYWFEQKKTYLNEVKPGSYVAYTGNNGCPEGHCDGTNANYIDDTDMGYCTDSSYKFSVNGWRVGYIENDTAYLISAAAPECMCTNSDGTSSDIVCATNETTSGTPLHFANLETKALSYCNPNYAYGGICNSTTAHNFNEIDFIKLTGSTIDECSNDAQNTLCGYNNDLIDVGGYYWMKKSTPTTGNTYCWSEYSDYAGYNFVGGASSLNTHGVRPVIRMDSNIIVVGGTGTYTDPYQIDIINSTPTLATEYVQNLYNQNSNKTVNIGGDTNNPTVSLNSSQGIMLDNNGEYRYYGANPNNYVEFNDELWRIISVSNVKSSETDTVGQTRVKIVKADILKDDSGLAAYSYDSSDSTVNSGFGVNDWSKADLMTELNTLYYNSQSGTCYTFSNNKTTACDFTNTGLNEEARELTGDALYYLGGSSVFEGLYADDYYNFERGTTVYTCNEDGCGGARATRWTGKIGIIYPSDHAYATDLSLCSKDGNKYNTDTNCQNNIWLTNGEKWTISPNSNGPEGAFIINSVSSIGNMGVMYTKAVQPTVYLKSNVVIIGGNGTSGNPYKLAIG